MNLPSDRETVLTRYQEGPAQLERALAGLQDADLDTPPLQGGWTIRQIVHHIVDGDDLWKQGIKAAMGAEDGEFTLGWYWAHPQQVWADRWAYAHRSLDSSVALLKANRGHVIQLLEAVPDGWNQTVGVRKPAGEIETVSVGFVVEMQADHVMHHVKRILAIRGEAGGA